MQLYVLMDAFEPTINPCILTVGLRMVYAPNSSSQVMMKRTPPNTTKFGGVVWLPNLIWVTCNMRQGWVVKFVLFSPFYLDKPSDWGYVRQVQHVWHLGRGYGRPGWWEGVSNSERFFLKQHFKMGPLNCRKQNETNKGKQETVWFFGHIPFWHLGPQVHLA